jgi:hypothetical protein
MERVGCMGRWKALQDEPAAGLGPGRDMGEVAAGAIIAPAEGEVTEGEAVLIVKDSGIEVEIERIAKEMGEMQVQSVTAVAMARGGRGIGQKSGIEGGAVAAEIEMVIAVEDDFSVDIFVGNILCIAIAD